MKTCWQTIVDKYYPQGSALRTVFLRHARQVTAEALAIAADKHLPLDEATVTDAAMLHDIGIFLTDAPGIHCHGSAPYLKHGPLGAALLREEGVAEEIARVAERHTGVGIPPYMPETLLERLICYVDKFYSKSGSMERKTWPEVLAQQAKFGADNEARLLALHAEFAPTPEM